MAVAVRNHILQIEAKDQKAEYNCLRLPALSSFMMEDLLVKHRKEQRDLQSKITQRKKNATKKTRKGVNDECETLQRELSERQKREVDALNGTTLEDGVEGLRIDDAKEDLLQPSDVLEETPPEQEASADSDITRKQVTFDSSAQDTQSSSQTTQNTQPKKPNRQKARLARRAAEQEAAAIAAAAEAANLPDRREQEISAMQAQLTKHNLVETSIRPDGHCLYSSFALSLPPSLRKSSNPSVQPYQTVRVAAADFISSHSDDFEAFLEEPLESYVRKIKETAEWGGQLELQAIARAYGVDVNVLRANGSVTKIEKGGAEGEGVDEDKEVWLAYYEHSFGLGEHYNALRRQEKDGA